MKNGKMAEATIRESTMCKMVIKSGENTIFTFLSNTRETTGNQIFDTGALFFCWFYLSLVKILLYLSCDGSLF